MPYEKNRTLKLLVAELAIVWPGASLFRVDLMRVITPALF